MGMFDSLYDATDREWQTKAFDCNLDVYTVGDTIPADTAASFQVEIGRAGPRTIAQLQQGESPTFFDSFATVRDGVLTAVDDQRDGRLPLLNYSGRVIDPGRSS